MNSGSALGSRVVHGQTGPGHQTDGTFDLGLKRLAEASSTIRITAATLLTDGRYPQFADECGASVLVENMSGKP